MRQIIHKPLVSIIIATYNEEPYIKDSLESLFMQSYNPIELIVVDDGSNDESTNIVSRLIRNRADKNILLLKESHAGPGAARNLGAKKSHGEILVFLDGDMTFSPSFIEILIKPIIHEKAIGTESLDEYLSNPENYWARNWNLGRFAAAGVISKEYLRTMVPNARNFGGTYRAILRTEFNRAGGFELGGDYNDDESLYRRIAKKAYIVNNARFYHNNPGSISEVWERASWIGQGRNFTGSFFTKILGILKYSPPAALIKAFLIGGRFGQFEFVPFKLVYDTAIWLSIIESI